MYPIMPESSAVWLISNTEVSDKQIADFTGLHFLIIQKMRKLLSDNQMSKYSNSYQLASVNLLDSGELSKSNIRECEKDANAKLKLIVQDNITYDNIRVDVRAPSIKKLSGIKWVVDRMALIKINDMFYSDVARFFSVSVDIVQQVISGTHRKSKLLAALHPVENKMISNDHLVFLQEKYDIK
ncbi:MAG: cell cycle transcriptional regulator TrcR [Pseudomonadota bacterium]